MWASSSSSSRSLASSATSALSACRRSWPMPSSRSNCLAGLPSSSASTPRWSPSPWRSRCSAPSCWCMVPTAGSSPIREVAGNIRPSGPWDCSCSTCLAMAPWRSSPEVDASICEETVMATKKIAVIVGSLRKQSLNRMMAKALIACAPASLNLEIVEIGQLPLYNQEDDDEGRPAVEWVAFREKLRPFDGVLFVTPEHNRSVPAALKNAIDIASRPYGKNIWAKKPGAVVSVSPGAIGGFGANHHLRQSLVFVDVPVMQQPEAYIGGAASLFDNAGKLVNESTQAFIKKFMESFAEWVITNSGRSS